MEENNQIGLTVPDAAQSQATPNLSISGDWNPTSFEFKPIDELFDIAPDYDDRVAADFRNTMQSIVPKVNLMIPDPVGYSKKENEFDSFSRAFNDPNTFMSGVKNEELYANPIISGAKTSGFDRISDHYKYDELGFNPLRDNEAYYNANSSATAEFFTRTIPYWSDLVGTAFMSGYKAIDHIFDSDSNYLLDADYESSAEFAEVNRMGSSTRGGFTGGAQNLFLQSGYTIGILTSIAAEELAMAAITAGSGGATTGGFLARTGTNFVKGIRSMGNLFDVTKAYKTGQTILESIRGVENARDAWAAARGLGAMPFRAAGQIFAPETMKLLKEIKNAETVGNGVNNAALMGKTFASFYRDMRAINFSMSEGKLEAGFAFNETFASGVKETLAQNGGDPLTEEQLKSINQSSLEAATESLWLNAPVIFLTNKLVLGTALKGMSPTFRRIFSSAPTGFAKNVVRKQAVTKAGKLTKGLYTDVTPKTVLGNFINLKRLKALGLRGSIKDKAHAILRYSAASIGEGLQEVYQEGVQVGVVDYHTALFKNPLASTIDAKRAAIKTGIKSQMSAQGAEVFMSGFLMGGIVQGPQRLAFEMIPEMYQRKKNPEQFAKYQELKKEYLKTVNEIGDELQDNPFDYFNPTNMSLFSSQEGDEETTKSLLEDDVLGFRDEKDTTAFMHRDFLMKAGASGIFVEQLQDLQNLSDDELKTLYPDSAKDITDVREKIQKSIDGMRVQEKIYKESFDIIKNPIDYEQFDKGSRKYNDARIKYNAIEHARLLYLISKDEFNKANARRYGIEEALESTDVLSNLQAGDLTKLLSSDLIDQEVVMLMKEIQTLQNVENPDTKLIKQKQKTLTTILAYKVKLDSIYDSESKVYDRSKTKQLRTPLINYLKTLGARGKGGGYIKRGEIDKVLSMLIDHNNLDTRSQLFDRTVALFDNPAKVLDLVDRISENYKVLYGNAKKIFKENIEKDIEDKHVEMVIKSIDELGIVLDDQEMNSFIQTGDVNKLVTFISEKGNLDPTLDKELYEKIASIKNVYKTATGVKEEVKEETKEKENKNKFDNIDDKDKSISEDKFEDILDDNLTPEVLDSIEQAPSAEILIEGQSPETQALLERTYGAFKLKMLNEGKAIPTIEEWLNSERGSTAFRALEKLKKMWFSTLSENNVDDATKESLYKSEEGFSEWVDANKSNSDVRFIIKLGGIDSSMFLPAKENQDLESFIDKKVTTIKQKGPGVNIVQTKVYQQGATKPDYIYRIVDNEGKEIAKPFLNSVNGRGTFGSTEEEMAEAWSTYEKLLDVVPKNQPILFDEQELKYGDKVEDLTTGETFVVLGTDSSTTKGVYLKLIPESKLDGSKFDRIESTFFIPEDGFSATYAKKVEKVASVKYSANMTKIDHRDINGVYAKQMLKEGTNTRESIEEAEARLQQALEKLTQDELNESNVTVFLNQKRDGVSYQLGSKPANPFVSKDGDKYTVGIKLSPSAADKVKEFYPDNWDGSIAFVRNGHFSFKGKSGQPISLDKFTENNLDIYIKGEDTSTANLKSQVVKQAALIEKLDKLVSEKSQMSLLEFQELTDTNLVVTDGIFSFDGIKKSLDDLSYGTYNGHTIIITNTKNKDGSLSQTYTTDIENTTQEIKVIEELKQTLNNSELENGQSNLAYVAATTGRYVAVVKSPTGTITLVQLKQSEITEQTKEKLFTDLLQRANDTIKDNVKDGKVLDSKYNYDWNDNFNASFYLASVPNSFVDLKVESNGDIILKLTVKDGKGKSSKVVLRAYESIKARNVDTGKAELVEELFNKMNANPKVVVYNKEVPNKVNLSSSSMTEVFATTAKAQEIIDKTTTDIDPRIRHSQKMYLDFTGDLTNIQEVVPTKVNVSKEEFNSFVDTGVVSDATLQAIANKIQNPNAGVLTPEESAIFENNTGEINRILADRKAKEDANSISAEPTVEQTLEEQIADLEIQKKKLSAEINKEAKDKGLNRYNLKQESTEYKDLESRIKALKAKRKNAFKIVGTAEAIQEDMKINEFISWAQANLPSFIQVRDIQEVKNRLTQNGFTAGKFVMSLRNLSGGIQGEGIIYTSPSTLIAYHEAFHGVFRMLLTTKEQNDLLRIAKAEVLAKLGSEKAYNTELGKFKNLNSMYQSMTSKRLEREYLEEYMADEFAKFKKNPRSTKTNSVIKSFFNRLVEWIKNTLKRFKRKSDLQNVFENIDAGKYRGSSIKDNFYTTDVEGDVTIEALKAIPYETIRGEQFSSDLYLDPATSDILIRIIANTYKDRVEKRDEKVAEQKLKQLANKFTSEDVEIDNIEKIYIGSVVADYAELYNPGRDIYSGTNLTDTQAEKLEQVFQALELNDGEAIIKEVQDYLELYKLKVLTQEDQLDELEQQVGVRNTSQYGMESQELGIKPSERVKMFITSTTVDSTDMFGNVEVIAGEKIKVSANYNQAHTGLMLAAMNQTSHFEILKRMYYHSRRSVNTSAVIDRFLETVGITDSNTTMEDVIQSGQLPIEVKNSGLYHDFIKTYQNSRFDYNFHLKDPNTGKSIIISASQSDAANSQIDAWKKFHGDKFELYNSKPETLSKAIAVMQRMMNLLGKSSLTDKKIRLESESLSKDIFEATGISFSRGFIEVSIISSLGNKGTKFQKEMSSIGNDSNLITKEDAKQFVDRLSAKKLNGKKLVSAPENLFVDEAGRGMSSRLNKLALGNANFDEAIGATVFVDVNNKLIYAHQKQTYHSNKIKQLNDVSYLEDLQDNTSEEYNSFLENNTLLNNPAFIQLAEDNGLTIIRNSGTRLADLAEDKIDNLNDASMKDDASSYGEMSSKEFLTMLTDMYANHYNTTSETNDKITYEENGKSKTVTKAPVLLRIMEASNTNDMVSLPIIETVNDKNLEAIGKYSILPSTIEIFKGEIKREYNAIKENFKEGIQGPQGILGYNDVQSDKKGKGRAFKFFKTEFLMTSDSIKKLLEAAEKGKSFEEADFDSGSIINALESLIDEYVNIAIKEKLATPNSKGDVTKINFNGISFLSRGIFPKTKKGLRAKEELSLNNNSQVTNLAQIILNNFINTMSINQLILGEEARLFKDAFVDPIKRAKMQNRAIVPVETTVIDPAKGIYHTLGEGSISMILVEDSLFDQKYTDKSERGKGEETDAQTYYTSKGARYFSYGLATLNDAGVKLFDKVDEGIEVTSEDFFGKNGFKSQNAILNSKKYVYGDGKVFDKMSTTPLTKEETSIVVDGVRVARQGLEELNNVREMMEEFERNNPEKIAFLVPVSASKMFKEKVQKLERLNQVDNPLSLEEITPLNAKDFGLQQVTPSNKNKVTLPNQIKTLITSEQDDKTDVLINGKMISLSDIKAEYHRLTGEGIKFEYFQKKGLMFNNIKNLDFDIIDTMVEDGEVSPSYATFLRTAQANLKSSAAGSNQIEFFTDENGTNKYELNTSLTIKKFEQFFLSYFSKGVLQEKVEGHALALKSSFGKSVIRTVYSLDDKGNIDKQEVIRRKTYEKSGNKLIEIDLRKEDGFDKLKEALAENPNGVTVIDKLRVDLPEYIKKGEPSTWKATNQRYAEGIVPAHYKEVMDLIENGSGRVPDAVAKMFAVRIPSQDKHSSLNVRIVDFDPVYLGSTGVFPAELVEISGADFDIDKVFTHVKEWYVKNGEFIEYGRGNVTQEESFGDYVTYQNKISQVKGSALYDALYKFDTTDVSSVSTLDPETFEELKKEYGYNTNTLNALTVLGLPRTFQEYKQYKKDNNNIEPYKAAINNQLLDYKTALLGNKVMTESIGDNAPIAYQPADVIVLKQEIDRLFEQFPHLSLLSKEDLPIDSLPGQYYTHINVKQNSNLIGAVVPRNVVINFLKETEVIMNPKWGEIRINDISHDRFVDYIVGTKETQRVQYILSALITAATDDAKERLLSKLGFNRSAIGNVETMVGLGIDLHVATMFVNEPLIKEALAEPFGARSIINKAVAGLIAKVEPVAVTTDTLAKSINEEASDAELLGIYQTMLTIMDAKKFIDNLIGVFNLNTGFGSDFTSLSTLDSSIDSLGIYETDKEFKKQVRPFDIRSSVKEHYVGSLLEVYDDFTSKVLPEVFMSRTKDFQNIFNSVLAYTNTNIKADDKDKISRNLLSYLTFKSYVNSVLNNEDAASQIGGSLSNEFIYGNANSKFNVNEVFENLREKLDGTSNYFLDYFLNSERHTDDANKTGLNLLTSRSFGRLSPNEKLRIQNGFHQLYGESSTRADAVNIIHYAMVKDGLQYDKGSIIDALVPFVMENYLDASSKAVRALQGKENIEDVFGTTIEELKKEFVDNYGEAAVNGRNVNQFNYRDVKSSPRSRHGYFESKVEDSRIYTRTDFKKNAFAFPLYIRYVTNGVNGNITEYYKLKRANVFKQDKKTLGDSLMNEALNDKVLADQVVYEKISLKGSYKQNAIGFMFDNENFSRPSIKEMKDANDKFSDIADFDAAIDDANFEDIDFSSAPDVSDKLQSFTNSNRIATENGINIDGQNIADANKNRPEGVNDATNKLLAFTKKGSLTQTSEVEVVSRYTNADVKANPDKIYVFGDNTKRTGTGGQAQIRNNENAFGIRTKVSPSTDKDAYFDESMGYPPMQMIKEDIDRIKADGRTVVFPKDGIGTGLAKLKEKAPRYYNYLVKTLQEEFGFNNDTGVVSQPAKQSVVESEELDRGEQLEFDLGYKDEDVQIINFFDKYIDLNKKNKAILKDAGIGTDIDGFTKSFKLSKFDTIKEFLDDQGCRIKL